VKNEPEIHRSNHLNHRVMVSSFKTRSSIPERVRITNGQPKQSAGWPGQTRC